MEHRITGLFAVAVVALSVLALTQAPQRTAPLPAEAQGAPAPAAAAPAAAAPAEPAVMELRAALAGLVNGDARRDEAWSILAVSLDRGDTLFAWSPDAALTPASNMKLLTTAAALEYLGPDHRFVTYVLADGPIRDGVLEGNLYLYGTGDPTLGTRFAERPAPALVALADTLELLGVREIRGDIVGDGTYFAGDGSGAGWQPDYMNAWYATPAGALSVHENLVRIQVSGGEAGHPPELSYIPGGEGVWVRNDAVSGGGGRARVVRSDYGGPILVTGRVGSGTSTHDVSVSDPPMYAAALFRDVLADRGVVLHGETRTIEDATESPITGRRVFAPSMESPESRLRVLAEHNSGPLIGILEVINHRSHNFYSEQVLRAIGRAAGGDGSAEAGGKAITDLMAHRGVDITGVRVADGSGLSPLNRASASSFIALLQYVQDSPHAELFMTTLPVAAETPRFRRMGGTPAAGNLRAKTGTIQNVSALSGYVRAANGERIAFSIIGNDLRSVAQGKHVENTIGARLAEFARAGPTGVANEDAGVAAVED
jgi:serine-type D-Ala-D-Ala carboxypeptidase/endopeptidase (penicillin-binding protein 4)